MFHRDNKSIYSDSDDIKDHNLDKDDEDIVFQEEKEIDDDEDKKENNNSQKKDKHKNPLFPYFLNQNSFPIIKKHGRKKSFQSSSSSSDELNQKIKKDLAENLNRKLSDFQKSLSKSQKEIFENNFKILKNDFKIIEQYEQIILKETSIDILFIMDLTGSMGSFLSEAKYNIKKVTEEIRDINPGVIIRLSFIGYRDFDSKEDERNYEIICFTENIDEFIIKLKKFECYGGGDQPEDVAGALNEALKLEWKSNAKYVVLVCDAPCHGKKYHDISLDTFSDGDPSGLNIEDLLLKFKKMNITFYCIEINDTTKKMFDIMKQIYDDDNKFSVELVGSASEKLTSFVAFSASELLGNYKYDKCSFSNVLNQFRKESIDKIMKKYSQKKNNISNNNGEEYITQSLINQLNNINLEGEDKQLVEFIHRMSNLEINNKEENCNIKQNKKENEDDYINLEYNQEYFLMNLGNDINYKINGITYNKNNIKRIDNFMEPEIIEQSFNTNIKINFGFPDNQKGSENNIIAFYDNMLCKECEGLAPKKIKKEFLNNIKLFTKKKCLSDLICEQVADYFNIEIKPESNEFIKFKKDVIYEKEEQNNDNKIIICDASLSFPETISEIPRKRILQAFIHFSYQITFGESIIMDLNLDKKTRK